MVPGKLVVETFLCRSLKKAVLAVSFLVTLLRNHSNFPRLLRLLFPSFWRAYLSKGSSNTPDWGRISAQLLKGGELSNFLGDLSVDDVFLDSHCSVIFS